MNRALMLVDGGTRTRSILAQKMIENTRTRSTNKLDENAAS
jgi:hypothetical protein